MEKFYQGSSRQHVTTPPRTPAALHFHPTHPQQDQAIPNYYPHPPSSAPTSLESTGSKMDLRANSEPSTDSNQTSNQTSSQTKNGNNSSNNNMNMGKNKVYRALGGGFCCKFAREWRLKHDFSPAFAAKTGKGSGAKLKLKSGLESKSMNKGSNSIITTTTTTRTSKGYTVKEIGIDRSVNSAIKGASPTLKTHNGLFDQRLGAQKRGGTGMLRIWSAPMNQSSRLSHDFLEAENQDSVQQQSFTRSYNQQTLASSSAHTKATRPMVQAAVRRAQEKRIMNRKINSDSTINDTNQSYSTVADQEHQSSQQQIQRKQGPPSPSSASSTGQRSQSPVSPPLPSPQNNHQNGLSSSITIVPSVNYSSKRNAGGGGALINSVPMSQILQSSPRKHKSSSATHVISMYANHPLLDMQLVMGDTQVETVAENEAVDKPIPAGGSTNGNTILTVLESEKEETVTKLAMPATKFRPVPSRRTLSGGANTGAGVGLRYRNIKRETSFLDGVLKVSACNRS